MIDINAWMDEALTELEYPRSEEPIREQVPPEQPYITWLQGKKKETKASGVTRFIYHEVHVYLWIPDGYQWNGLMTRIAEALIDAGALKCAMQGMSYIPEIQRKMVQLNMSIREDVERGRAV